MVLMNGMSLDLIVRCLLLMDALLTYVNIDFILTDVNRLDAKLCVGVGFDPDIESASLFNSELYLPKIPRRRSFGVGESVTGRRHGSFDSFSACACVCLCLGLDFVNLKASVSCMNQLKNVAGIRTEIRIQYLLNVSAAF
jgi:hypothetical protein